MSAAVSSTKVPELACPHCGKNIYAKPAGGFSTEALADGWNLLCATPHGLPKVMVPLAAGRASKARLRLKAYPDPDQWREVFTLIGQSKFLRGLAPSRNGQVHAWRCTFDWLIANDTNVAKVLEGQYADQRGR